MRAPVLVRWVVLPSLAALALGCSGGPDNTCKSGAEALSVCAGANTVKGVDVSYYQGTIDWSAAKGAGVKFAIARVSDGTTFEDPKFAANWSGMKAQGIVRGVYQFFRPGQDPVKQADLLVDTINKLGTQATDLPPVMDIETVDGVATSTLRANMKKWLDRVEQRVGRKPIIYTAAFMSSTIGTGWTAYPLWVANYGVSCPTMPSDWTKWKFWQSSSTGKVAGISGNVDVDAWNGTLQELIDWANPPAPNPPPPSGDAGAPANPPPTSTGTPAAPPPAPTTPAPVDPCAP